ncbi:MAG: ABC transporter permease [Pseudomonadota bacterium]|nr:ABC transporter permease [Pseudomonadota bacterium]
MLGLLRGLWTYRHFVLSSIVSEFRIRFMRSRLGGFWLILHPLATVAIYVLVLSEVMAAKLPGIEDKFGYALYLMAGMLAWSLFSEVTSRSLTLFIENGNLMKKMAFPRICMPAILVGSALLNNLLLLSAILVVFGILGAFPDYHALWIPLLILLNLGLAVGFGLFLGVFNVFMRDLGQVMTIVLQFWFWLTPIVYTASILPAWAQKVVAFNPLYHVVTAYQKVLVYRQMPNFSDLVPLSLAALVLVVLALLLFRKASPEMVDVL